MIATYQRTIFEKGDFSICSFKPEDESEPPQNAMKYGTFVGVGVNIPHSEDVKLNLDGDWESNKYGLQMKMNIYDSSEKEGHECSENEDISSEKRGHENSIINGKPFAGAVRFFMIV